MSAMEMLAGDKTKFPDFDTRGKSAKPNALLALAIDWVLATGGMGRGRAEDAAVSDDAGDDTDDDGRGLISAVGVFLQASERTESEIGRRRRRIRGSVPEPLAFASAALDRLLHHSDTLRIQGQSYKLKQKKAGLLW